MMDNSADMLAFGSAVGGFGCHRGGRSARLNRDFVASPSEAG
jgi:hypothetical protein